MPSFTALVSYDRAWVINKLNKEIKKIEDKINNVIIPQYEIDVNNYKKLGFFSRIFISNPEKNYSEYVFDDALDKRTRYYYSLITRLSNQIKALELSDEEKVFVNSESWLIEWLFD